MLHALWLYRFQQTVGWAICITMGRFALLLGAVTASGAALAAASPTATAPTKPVQVFIMMGQSNMLGEGRKDGPKLPTLESVVTTEHMYVSSSCAAQLVRCGLHGHHRQMQSTLSIPMATRRSCLMLRHLGPADLSDLPLSFSLFGELQVATCISSCTCDRDARVLAAHSYQ